MLLIHYIPLILLGTLIHFDAVMLSGETAIGKYPVESVQIMSKIADSVERMGKRWGGGIFVTGHKQWVTGFQIS